jgi:hypothetical protein
LDKRFSGFDDDGAEFGRVERFGVRAEAEYLRARMIE